MKGLALMGVAVIFIIAGIYFYYAPIWSERTTVNPPGGIEFLHNSDVQFNNLRIEFDLRPEKQYLTFRYGIHDVKRPTYAILSLPYSVSIVNIPGQGTNGWKTLEPLPDGRTLSYKQFNCSDESPCSEGKAIHFFLNEKIDSKINYVHSINIPIRNYFEGSTNIPNDYLSEMRNTSISLTNGFGRSSPDPVLMMAIPGEATEFNTYPTGSLIKNYMPYQEQHNKVFTASNIFSWEFTERASSFYLEYVIPQERTEFVDSHVMSFILMGIGSGFLVNSVAELIFNRGKNRS